MWLRIGLALVGLALGVGVFSTGAIDLLSEPERAADFLRGLGIWGYLLYLVSFALLEPFGVPGVLFVIPAALVWPKWLAALLSVAGATGAGIVGGGFARFVARDWVEARMPQRFLAFDQRLAENGLRTVILVRLFFFLAAPAHWVLGLSAVPFRTLILGSAIGFIPGIVALTLVGGPVMELARSAPPWVWAGLGLAIAGGLLLRSRRARAARLSRDEGIEATTSQPHEG